MSRRIQGVKDRKCTAGLAGAHPGLQDRMLLNYTRIELLLLAQMGGGLLCGFWVCWRIRTGPRPGVRGGGSGGGRPPRLENFQGKRHSCSKILDDKKYSIQWKISGKLCFSGQALVAQKSWTVKIGYSDFDLDQARVFCKNRTIGCR